VAVYDTLFVELAQREQIPFVTFGQKLLAAFPQIAIRPKDLSI
jgi:predicted nucleic acid-binding protein